jgi:uncharacterized membrane protein (UPF0127 family)
LAVIALLLLSAIALSCGSGAAAYVTVRIGTGAPIRAELALTPGARTLGLGGRDSLDRGAGMLFVFPRENVEPFWMRGMRFPLDFVWISAGKRVLEVTENIAAPAAGAPDSALQLYRPAQPVRFVLEINAGRVRALGIQVGDAVRFQPEVNVDRAR